MRKTLKNELDAIPMKATPDAATSNTPPPPTINVSFSNSESVAPPLPAKKSDSES
jgi:hypothetical protein